SPASTRNISRLDVRAHCIARCGHRRAWHVACPWSTHWRADDALGDVAWRGCPDDGGGPDVGVAGARPEGTISERRRGRTGHAGGRPELAHSPRHFPRPHISWPGRRTLRAA